MNWINKTYIFQLWKFKVSLTAPEVCIFSLALVVNFISALGTSIIFQPDSGGYLLGAYHILYEGSFSSLGLNRTPGYPLFLVPLLKLFGVHLLFALKIVQHIIAVFASLLVVKIGDELDASKALGLLAGILSCFCLQFQSYAHLPMTEVLFASTCMLGALFVMRYIRTDRSGYFIFSIVAFSFATLIRPQAKLLNIAVIGIAFLRFVFPRWNYLNASENLGNRAKKLMQCAIGAMISAVILLPFMFYNKLQYDVFKLSGTFGLNLYSNAVEYADLADESSDAIKDIRAKWDVGERMRIRQGLEPETTYTWKNHWPSIDRYRLATGLHLAQADPVYLQAALDSIRANPWDYLKHCATGFYKLMTHYEPTYLYVPIPKEKIQDRRLYKHMRDIREAANTFYSTYAWVFEGKLRYFDPATIFTPIYAGLVQVYHPIVGYQGNAQKLFVIFILGIVLISAKALRPKGMTAAFLLFYFSNQIVLPLLIVPWSPRHRLGTDPVIQIFYGTVLLFLFQKSGRIVACIRDHFSKKPKVEEIKR